MFLSLKTEILSPMSGPYLLLYLWVVSCPDSLGCNIINPYSFRISNFPFYPANFSRSSLEAFSILIPQPVTHISLFILKAVHLIWLYNCLSHQIWALHVTVTWEAFKIYWCLGSIPDQGNQNLQVGAWASVFFKILFGDLIFNQGWEPLHKIVSYYKARTIVCLCNSTVISKNYLGLNSCQVNVLWTITGI